MPNKRISDLKEAQRLNSLSSIEPFNHQAKNFPQGSGDGEAMFIIAREKSHNERLSYKSLKSSMTDNVVWLTGNQLISGQKVFADECTFLSRTNVSEILDFTQESGDISGNIFVGNTGLLQNLGVGQSFFERSSNPSCSLDISGDSLFEGELTHTGNSFHFGNLTRIDSSALSGNFNLTGDSFIKGDKSMLGDFSLSGSIEQTFFQSGNHLVSGDITITGDLGVGDYLYNLNDEDTFLKFRDDEISLQAGGESEILIKESGSGNYISFSPNENEAMRMVDNGFVGVNTTEPIGELSVTGHSFFQDIFVYDELSDSFVRVYGGDDETVTFKTLLEKGKDKQQINIPKTFKDKPILSASLQHEGQGRIIPFILSDVTESEFNLKLGEHIPDNSYYLHTTALATSVNYNGSGINYNQFSYPSCQDPAQDRHRMQRFYSTLTGNSNVHEIYYPIPYNEAPIISVNIEAGNNVIPYSISSVNKESYKIIFASKINQKYTIHTFSSTTGLKRLG